MPQIKIKYPQIVVETKIIEISEEEYEALIEGESNQTDFIWNNMTEQEQNWTNGKGWVDSAIDMGYAGISKL